MGYSKALQHNIDCTLILQHGSHDEEGYKLGNCNGEYEEESPHSLELGTLTINDHSKDHTQEIVQEGCKDCPDEGPS